MINKDQAVLLVQKHIDVLANSIGEPLKILHKEVIDKPYGWIFFYNSEKYIETGDIRHMLAGNSPLLVDKNGSISQLGTAYPIDHYIAEYEKEKRGR